MNLLNPDCQPTIKTITITELHALGAQRQVELLDVRTPQEFAAIRAAAARNVPLDTLDPASVMGSRRQGADEPLYLICKMGGRSAQACLIFMAAGYPNVVNVAGGTEAWVEAGLPAEQGGT